MILRITCYFLTGAMCLTLMACAKSDNFAPVVDVKGYDAVPSSGVYRVTSRDTLYSIAWRYGIDYRELAKNNHIEAPYAIYAGQVIHLHDEVKAPARVTQSETVYKPLKVLPPQPEEKPIIAISKPTPKNEAVISQASKKKSLTLKKISEPAHSMAEVKEPNFKINNWLWPAHGKLLTLYSSSNKGIDIGGTIGAPVYAAAPGKVVYAGSGLRGYGNLIILKHNGQFLSAYAYNKRLFVHEGDWVKKRQVIAAMGQKPGGGAGLHFEIRRAGNPVNPLNLLQ